MPYNRRRKVAHKAISLRLRLFLVILPPLLVVSVLLGLWRYEVAQQTSEDLFDRSLLAAALAISRDITISFRTRAEARFSTTPPDPADTT